MVPPWYTTLYHLPALGTHLPGTTLAHHTGMSCYALADRFVMLTRVDPFSVSVWTE